MEETKGSAYGSWCEQWALECLRLLTAGGHLVAFGGTRTWHRLAAALEDAGFEIRDSIAWLSGNGFHKSLDLVEAIGAQGQRWQGWGTGLKPAFAPIVVARRPLMGTTAATVRRVGTGGLQIDACRVPLCAADREKINAEHAGMNAETYVRPPGASLNLSVRPLPLKRAHAHPLGRWPANVVLTYAKRCRQHCAVGCPVAKLDQQSSPAVSYGTRSHSGPARLFPAFRWQPKAPRAERPSVGARAHPTVKPLDLVRWLARLVTPSGGLVLDSFLGSGTTAEAARLEGCRCIGIEGEADYLPLIRARLHGGDP